MTILIFFLAFIFLLFIVLTIVAIIPHYKMVGFKRVGFNTIWNVEIRTSLNEKLYKDEIDYLIKTKGFEARLSSYSCKYLDKELLEDCYIVLRDDLNEKYNAVGVHKTYYSYLKFRKIHLLMIDVKLYEDREIYNKENIGSLICHEYIHAWKEKHEGNSDPDHRTATWKELNC